MDDDGTVQSRHCRVIPPLAGHTITLTGDRRVDELAAHLEAVGATTLVGPMLRTRPDGDAWGELWAATAAVIACPPDYLVATTAIGLRSWLDAAAAWGLRTDLVDALRTTKILARGPKVVGALHTADLPIWLPDRTGSLDRLLDALAAHPMQGTRVAVQVPGQEGEQTLAQVERLGANVVAVDAYDLTWPEDLAAAGRLLRAVAEGRVSAVTFTSRAAVRNFFALADVEGVGDEVIAALGRDVLPLCVGTVTARALNEVAGVAASLPEQPNLGAMAEALSIEMRTRHHRHLRATGHDVIVQGRLVGDRGSTVVMSDREAAVLQRLMASAGRVVSGDVLLRSVWPGETVEPAVIETTMTRLRRRLRGTGVVIETVRRRGYVLLCDVTSCGAGSTDAAPNLSAPIPA